MTSRVRASILTMTFAAIVALPALAAAQSPATIGVKAGVNFAKVKFEDDENSGAKSLLGAVGGLFVSKAINDGVGVRVEGLFSQKGVKFEDGNDEGKYKLTYLDVPVLLTFGPSSSTGARFNFFTGPQISFKLNDKFEVNGVDFSDENDNNVKSTDFAWVLGAGVESGRFTADARYALGLTNISGDSNDSDKPKNRVFSVMVGVKLK